MFLSSQPMWGSKFLPSQPSIQAPRPAACHTPSIWSNKQTMKTPYGGTSLYMKQPVINSAHGYSIYYSAEIKWVLQSCKCMYDMKGLYFSNLQTHI